MLHGLIQGGFDRRDFLCLAAAGVPAALATTSLGAVAATAATMPKAGAFDPQSPIDNLRAYIRMSWIGRRSFGDDKLVANLRALIDALNKAKPATSKGVYLRKVAVSSTMGPGVQVDLSSLGA